MQKARRHCQKAAPTACRRTVSGTVSLPCPGFFSPFPHGTGTLSVSYSYLALPDGPGGFTQDSSCPALLRIPLGWTSLRVRAFHPLRTDFPNRSAHDACCHVAVLQPQPKGWFRLFRFRSPLLSESLLFSFPPGTKMFQFPGLSSVSYVLAQR